MSSFNNTNNNDLALKNKLPFVQAKNNKDCLICRITQIQHERQDMVRWILNSKKSIAEKTRIASMLTGIDFDEEIIEYLNDPTIRSFILSE
ncbi:MAG: hypothetical protein FK734_02055 [Asgard group archaeon]|nr:hypothetical protein [Asgard group archaeon]